MGWSESELTAIGGASDFHIAPLREDGETYGTMTYIWSVAAGDAVYVRAYSGTGSSWYQAAKREGAGRIRADGTTHEVAFTPVEDADTLDRVDDAYRAKYPDSRYLAPMIAERARAATVRVDPRTAQD